MAKFTIREAWRKNDPQIEADAIAMWERLAVLPPNVRPEERVRDIVAAAYDGDTLVGLGSVTIAVHQPVNRKFAFYRVLVDPDSRRQNLSRELAASIVNQLEAWAGENPEEELYGVAGIWQGKDEFFGKTTSPVWDYGSQLDPPIETPPMILGGYAENGQEIWLRWFENVMV